MLSGMRFLGEKAVEVAKSQMSKSAPTEHGGGVAGLSATGSGNERERRRYSSNLALLSPVESEIGGNKGGAGGVGPSTTHKKVERGSLVRVVDLLALVSSKATRASSSKTPMLVAGFIASRSQTIANLKFSPDGCSILAVPKDGQVTKVFKLHPLFPAPSSSASSPPSTTQHMEEASTGTATHLYDLRRGVSGALIEGLEVLDDGLLVGVTTRNRTVHVFATNPGGGRTDVGSHASGRVRNGVLVRRFWFLLHVCGLTVGNDACIMSRSRKEEFSCIPLCGFIVPRSLRNLKLRGRENTQHWPLPLSTQRIPYLSLLLLPQHARRMCLRLLPFHHPRLFPVRLIRTALRWQAVTHTRKTLCSLMHSQGRYSFNELPWIRGSKIQGPARA